MKAGCLGGRISNCSGGGGGGEGGRGELTSDSTSDTKTFAGGYT